MSRDATGIWSRQATRSVACPVCAALPGVACDLSVGPDEAVEHATHFARTEEGPGELENACEVEEEYVPCSRCRTPVITWQTYGNDTCEACEERLLSEKIMSAVTHTPPMRVPALCEYVAPDALRLAKRVVLRMIDEGSLRVSDEYTICKA